MANELNLVFETPKATMDEHKAGLDAGLKEQFPGGLLKWSWTGDVLDLTGPGAVGTIVLEDGKLIGRADLKPPASLMKPMVEQKITAAMKKAIG